MKESAEGSVASGDVKSLEKNSEIGAKSLPKAEEISQTVSTIFPSNFKVFACIY